MRIQLHEPDDYPTLSLVAKVIDIFWLFVLICILGLFLFVEDAAAAEWWDNTSKAEVAAETLIVVDWLQTRDIVRHQSDCSGSSGVALVDLAKQCGANEYYETNPIIGKHPSMARVNTYFIGVIVGHWLLDQSLSAEHRKWLENGTIMLELGVVGHNQHIGLRVKF